MKEKHGKLWFDAKLAVDKSDPKELVDLYVTAEEHAKLCEIFGQNRIAVALRIKGVG